MGMGMRVLILRTDHCSVGLTKLTNWSHRKFLLLITRGLDDDGASGAIDGETHPVGDTLSRLWYADDRRDTILAGHDSAMRHRPTHFHHQATSSEEEGCPARVGRGRDQDLPVFQASGLWLKCSAVL